jgi:endonuclease YncB( thermonuclease family)
MEWIACGGLVVSLLVFLLSTRQVPLAYRAAIWLTGLLILIGAGICAAAWPGHFGLIALLQDAAQGGDLIGRAVPADLPSIGAAIAPLVDVFMVFAAVMALFALIAFTPGEAIEKIMRPMLIATVGALAGALIALILVATGMAGYIKHRIYMRPAEAVLVYDGDTIRLDDVSLRLAGIDAPERTQSCIAYDRLTKPCGMEAAHNLQRIIQEAMVICQPPANLKMDDGAPIESFGRPIMQCFARSKAGAIDLGKQMVEDGYAAPFPDETSPYKDAFATAQAERKGILDTCTLAPWAWRTDAAARRLFEAANPALLSGVETIGYCSFLTEKHATE